MTAGQRSSRRATTASATGHARRDPFVADPIPPVPPLDGNNGGDRGAAGRTRSWCCCSGRGRVRTPTSAATYAADVFSDVLNQPGSRFQRRLVDSGLWQSIGVNYYTLNQVGPITIGGDDAPGEAARGARGARSRAARGGEAGLHHRRRELDGGEAAAHRRARWRASSARRASRTSSASGGRSRASTTSSATSTTMAQQTPDGPPAYASRYIVGQAARDRRADLARDAPGAASSPKPSWRREARRDARASRVAAALLLVGALASLAVTRPATIAPASGRRTGGDAVRRRARHRRSTTKFEVDGIPVILRRNTGERRRRRRTSTCSAARGSSRRRRQGIEALLLAASERGTRRFPGALLRQRTARLGSTIGIEAGEDWTSDRAARDPRDASTRRGRSSPIASWRRRSTPAEVELVREQMLTAARDSAHATPTTRAIRARRQPARTADTRTRSSRPAPTRSLSAHHRRRSCEQYHAQQIVTSRMLLVVVGNVDRAQIERLVHATLGTLPRGSYRWTPPPTAADGGRALAFDNRPLPTNYLLGYVPGPPATSSGLHGAARRDGGAVGAALHRGPLAPQPDLRRRGAVPGAGLRRWAACT